MVQGRSAGDGGGGQGGGREQQREETTTNHGDVEFSRYVREDSRRRADCGGECGVRSGRVLGSYSRERDARRPGGELEDGLGRRRPGTSPRTDRFRILIGSVGASHWYCRRRAPVKPTGHSRRRETVRSRPRAKRLRRRNDRRSKIDRKSLTKYGSYRGYRVTGGSGNAENRGPNRSRMVLPPGNNSVDSNVLLEFCRIFQNLIGMKTNEI